jgi:uncharacterized protein involved in type VI secretion and phage assembly
MTMSATAPAETSARPSGRETTRHYGKYRGLVTDNKDPKDLGRVRVKVPEILGDVESGWALPCAPYSGDKTGAFTIPSAGAGVWVEFEAGDVSRPIWSGSWWAGGKLPTDRGGASAKPDLKILRSEQGLMVALHDDAQELAVSDKDGRNLLLIQVQSGKVTVKAATKVVVEAPQIELVENASHPVVFGDNLMTYLNQLVTLFNAHMHPGQLAAGVLPVTPMPPVAPFTPPTPDLLSMKVKAG